MRTAMAPVGSSPRTALPSTPPASISATNRRPSSSSPTRVTRRAFSPSAADQAQKLAAWPPPPILIEASRSSSSRSCPSGAIVTSRTSEPIDPTTSRNRTLATVERLERDRSFLLLWAGQTISTLGSTVSDLAIPTAAIFLFHAGPFQVSLLGALETLPFVGVGLLLGPIADRVRRRPILIACDVGRFLVLGSIPLAP